MAVLFKEVGPSLTGQLFEQERVQTYAVGPYLIEELSIAGHQNIQGLLRDGEFPTRVFHSGKNGDTETIVQWYSYKHIPEIPIENQIEGPYQYSSLAVPGHVKFDDFVGGPDRVVELDYDFYNEQPITWVILQQYNIFELPNETEDSNEHQEINSIRYAGPYAVYTLGLKGAFELDDFKDGSDKILEIYHETVDIKKNDIPLDLRQTINTYQTWTKEDFEVRGLEYDIDTANWAQSLGELPIPIDITYITFKRLRIVPMETHTESDGAIVHTRIILDGNHTPSDFDPQKYPIFTPKKHKLNLISLRGNIHHEPQTEIRFNTVAPVKTVKVYKR